MLDVDANKGRRAPVTAHRVEQSGTVMNLMLGPGADRRAIASVWHTTLCYKNATQWIEVDSYTLDSLCFRLGVRPIELVKIYVECAEAEVIDGLTCILHEDWPTLLGKTHHFHASREAHTAAT